MSSKDVGAMSEENKEKSALVPRLRFPEFRGAGVWSEKTLGVVCDMQAGKFVAASDISENIADGMYPCFGGNGLRGYTKTYNQSGRYSLIGRQGALCGNVNLVDGKFYATEHAVVATPKAGNGTDWLFYNLCLLNLNRFATGQAQPGLSIEVLEKVACAVPKEIGEQQKIADCLSSLDELIAAENQKLDVLKTHKKGLMQQLFPREGETVPRMRFPDFSEAGEWEERTLAEVCNVLQGYGFPEVLQGRSEGKYPFCKVSDISRAVAEKGGLLNQATNYVDDNDLLKLRAKIIPEGATVFAKIGEALRLNRRAYVQKECVIDNNATGLKAIDGVSDDYFVYLLSQLIDLNKHCGGAVPSVNKSTLEEIEVVVPGSNEQKRIAESLFSLDNCITAQSQKIDALKTHKKGLMQQLFPVLNEVPA